MVEEKDKQSEERQDESRLWRPWRPPRRRMWWRVLWAVGMVVAVLTTALLIVDLRPEIWKDLLEGHVLTLVALGLSLTAILVLLAIAGAFQGKTVWDWLELLIVPVVLSLITVVFTWQQDARQQDIENKRAAVERGIEEQRAQDEALRAYLDQMNYLLLEKNLRNSDPESEVRNIARARTLTVLARLDPTRKEDIMRFLTEADLVRRVDEQAPVISLSGADLSNTEVVEVDLSGADLEHAILIDANLIFTDLSNANLEGAILNKADLRFVNLTDADLNSARLNDTDLRDANLSKARLIWADLRNADLRDGPTGTNLKDADLYQADLSGAEGVTESELEAEAMSLDCAIMPDGSQRPSDLQGSCYASN